MGNLSYRYARYAPLYRKLRLFRLLAALFGEKIIFYDLRNNHELGSLLSYGDVLDFSPDGRMLAVGGGDGVVYIYGIPVNE